MKPFDFILHDNISPNSLYYFEVQKEKELNKAAFGARISFYNSADELLYFNHNSYAHELNDPESIKRGYELMMSGKANQIPLKTEWRLASWSTLGNMVYILEYSHDSDGHATYTDVIIDLAEGCCWRLKAWEGLTDDIVVQLGLRRDRFEESAVEEVMRLLSVPKVPLIRDHISKSIFSKKWYK